MTAKILTAQQLTHWGMLVTRAKETLDAINQALTQSPEQAWQQISTQILQKHDGFNVFNQLYHWVYRDYAEDNPGAAWISRNQEHVNLNKLLHHFNLSDCQKAFNFCAKNRERYWQWVMAELQIQFTQPYSTILPENYDVTQPYWLPDAKFNIVDSCFQANADDIAIIYQTEQAEMQTFRYAELLRLTNRVANGLIQQGFKAGDAIAIDMVMDINCIAIYLGIIKAGCVVVSIADSFASDEIATRLRIANAKAIFTQDYLLRAGKKIPLYEKVAKAHAATAIVIPCQDQLNVSLQGNDLAWQDFLADDEEFISHKMPAGQNINILFSSGTTGDPKAIPWAQTTPIKAAADAFIHQNVQAQDVIAWPTNIGWMMGPWLIFASLINRASMALFAGSPTTAAFGEFIEKSQVTILGLVPSMVKAWRSSTCMESFDWSNIKCFSSSGECSNAEDMLYLMYLANMKPIIEYCGGTEIGGAYLSSTLLQDNIPAAFSTPTFGLDITILDEQGHATNNGEVAIIPPSIGLSNALLNRDHHAVYFANMPKNADHIPLRRHGDQIQRLANGYYRALGRVDDTMNLGGIKTSSADIERCLAEVAGVQETAAVAVNPKGGGPSMLVIFIVLDADCKFDKDSLHQQLQQQIKQHLNPLFKIHDLVIVKNLPRTASNKVMRRVLRDEY